MHIEVGKAFLHEAAQKLSNWGAGTGRRDRHDHFVSSEDTAQAAELVAAAQSSKIRRGNAVPVCIGNMERVSKQRSWGPMLRWD